MQKISDTELEVLKFLWEKDVPISSTEICNELNRRNGWEKTTIRTLIARLLKKGAIIKQKREIYYYVPAILEEDYLAKSATGFLNQLFRGDAKNLICTLMDENCVTPEELDEIKDYWTKQKKGE